MIFRALRRENRSLSRTRANPSPRRRGEGVRECAPVGNPFSLTLALSRGEREYFVALAIRLQIFAATPTSVAMGITA